MTRLSGLLIAILGTSGATGQQPDSVVVNTDSLWVEQVKKGMMRLDNIDMIPARDSVAAAAIDKDSSTSPFLQFRGGYIQYFAIYRTRIDTPYAESDVLQHLTTVSGRFTVAGQVPVTVNLFDRRSNSAFFRDFTDIRIDIDGGEMRRLQSEKLRRYLFKQLHALQDTQLNNSIDWGNWNINRFKLGLQHPQLIRLLMQSKERLIHIDERDPTSTWKDSISIYAHAYIRYYERHRHRMDSLAGRLDTLKLTYARISDQLGKIRKLIERPQLSADDLIKIRSQLKAQGIPEKELPRSPGFLHALNRLSIGRTMPDMSALTVRNINVKGINAEWGNGHWYAAIVAGVVDFRIRDYFSTRSNRLPRQYVYAARAGWGSREGTHLFFTGYSGNKQVYSFNKPALSIAGLSGEFQYAWKRNHRVSVEVAQSSVPRQNDISGSKPGFSFSDRNATAYNFQWRSVFPKLQARFEGNYQRSGIHFYSFNSYRANAATESWSVRYEQFFFGRQFRLTAAARKNDFFNPLVEQRFETNTVFKTLQLSFRKRNWPSLSIGYMPSSQFVVVDSQVYETHYRSLTGTANYNYRVGEALASTNIFLSQFFNAGTDSLFIYDKAKHVSVFQQFSFARHMGTAGMTYTRSHAFSLLVMQVGASTFLLKRFQLEFGTKINQLNKTLNKAGIYARLQCDLPMIGQLSAAYDDGYLPGLNQRFFRNQQLTAGLIRYFK